MSANAFRQAIEALGEPVILVDATGCIRFANPATERVLGYGLAALIGLPFEELLPERHRRVNARPILQHLLVHHPDGAGGRVRLPLLRQNRVELEFDVGVAQAPSGLAVVTLRERPEPAPLVDPVLGPPAPADPCVVESEQMYRTVVENAPMGIFHFDRSGVLVACNEYFVRIIGSSRQLLIGLRLLTLRDRGVTGAVREVLEGRSAHYEGEYASMTAAKVTPVRAHFAPCFDAGGGVSGGVGIVEDTTDERRQQAERQAALAQVELVFEHAPVGLAFLDPQLRYVRINEQLARLNGQPVAAHLGRTVSEVVGASSGRRLERALRRVLRSGRPFTWQGAPTDAFGLPGPRRYFSVSVYRLTGSAGEVLGLGGVVQEETERFRAEAERERLIHEAQAAVRARDEFLSIASHELKTPLTPLSLRLQALEKQLRRGQPLDPAQLSRARGDLVRLTRLINDLLDVARLEAGRMSLRLQVVRLDQLVARVARAQCPPGGRHVLELDLPERPVPAELDPDRVEQVLTNLVDNAVKYSPEGGPVAVRLLLRGGFGVIAVSDHGIGIPSDQQRSLFERFFRGRNVSGQSYGGLGLGLYIARDIVEQHGGRIWVDSELGRGSTFYVALPVLPQPEARNAPDPAR